MIAKLAGHIFLSTPLSNNKCILLYRRVSAPLSSSAAAECRYRRVARILLGPVWDTGQ
jgi:hypothetical protein